MGMVGMGGEEVPWEELSFSNSVEGQGFWALLLVSHPRPMDCYLCNVQDPRPPSVKLPQRLPHEHPSHFSPAQRGRGPHTADQECGEELA